MNEQDQDACPSWRRPREYELVVAGDSQFTFMCEDIKSLAPGIQLRNLTVKGTLFKSWETWMTSLKSATSSGVLLLNLAGLWEVAYGNMDDYGGEEGYVSAVREAIKVALKSSFREVFVLTTTAVHPSNYPALMEDSKKWAMTMPRVQYVNSIWRRVALEMNINVIEAEALSLARASDPRSQGDMRHFGKETSQLLFQSILCQVDSFLN